MNFEEHFQHFDNTRDNDIDPCLLADTYTRQPLLRRTDAPLDLRALDQGLLPAPKESTSWPWYFYVVVVFLLFFLLAVFVYPTDDDVFDE